MRLTLASASPRRRELLTQIGVEHDVRPVDIDESVHEGEDPREYVQRMAREKLDAALALGAEFVLAADTSVVFDGAILAKPMDDADNVRMVRTLSGQTHTVMSAIAAARRSGDELVRRYALAETHVSFASLSDDEIATFVRTGEGLDKAGGYGIQGAAAAFVERIEGSYSAVVGLPLHLTHRVLSELQSA